MSSHKVFPVFTVRGWDGTPCGHQHQTQDRAENCALSQAMIHRGKVYSIRKWFGTEDEASELVSLIEVKSQYEVAEETYSGDSDATSESLAEHEAA